MADINTRTTHDLWVDARAFTLDISRTTPTSVTLSVSYPTAMTVAEGAVVLLHDKAITTSNYPQDGTQYAASTDFALPADILVGQNGAHVVGFYSGILGNPLPGIPDVASGRSSFTITVTNTQANTLYYASVHAASNILQYYPLGIQSYPLEASRIEKDSSTFTGNIPSLPEAPTSPTSGFVYHDKGLNLIQYWTGTQWIPTRFDSVMTGPYNPGILGQVYLFSALSQLKVFNGVRWTTATPANFTVRDSPSSFIPLGTVTSGVKLPEVPALGDLFYDYALQRAQYWDGVQWVYPSPSNTLYNGGPGPATPAFTLPITVENEQLADPYLGQLFYNTTSRVLNVWNGQTWQQANTDQQGTPTTDKVAIGTDGSYDERIRLIKALKTQLGHPTLCVELGEEHFNIAIDNALDNYRAWCDGAYAMKYILFTVREGQQTYYLNSAIDKTDSIVTVSKIHRLNILGGNSLNWDSNIYFQTFLNQYYSSGYTDILSIHLMHSLSEDFERIFAGNLTFLWNEASRELLITRKIARNEKVILECFMERTEQELILDRYAKQFIQNWSLAECKMQLGLIRSKYSSGTPGPAGTINLNGEMLVSEARQDMTELKEELFNYEYGGLVGQGNASFLLG
jgi:hypothetical protein